MGRFATEIDYIAQLEAAYRSRLIEALEACAEGQWGLFDRLWAFMPEASQEAVADLMDLGEVIDEMRQAAGRGPFPLHQQFRATRAANDDNIAGEAMRARDWLRHMQAS
ncbi:hypothetical protein BH11PSE2_BH11PSE2_02860 [soil metagenome]